MLNEAVLVMLGGTTIAGVWSIWSWKVRRKDQKADKVENETKVAAKAKISEIHLRLNKIEGDDLKLVEGRLKALEATVMDRKEMQELLNSTLETHLNPIVEIERKNSEELTGLKDRLQRIEIMEQLKAQFQKSQIPQES